jgi:hypothetical protein
MGRKKQTARKSGSSLFMRAGSNTSLSAPSPLRGPAATRTAAVATHTPVVVVVGPYAWSHVANAVRVGAEMSKKLRFPMRVLAFATFYFHTFLRSHGYSPAAHEDPHFLMFACIFVAGKVAEVPLNLLELLNVYLNLVRRHA